MDEWNGEERREMRQDGIGIERHVQTAIGVLVAGLFLWFGWGAQEQVTRLDERVLNLQHDLKQLRQDIQEGMSDRYHAQEAIRDLQLRDQRIDSNSKGLDALSKRVTSIERKVYGVQD